MNTVESLKDCIDSVLSVRDSVGAALKEVYLVTRVWSGSEPGDGDSKETAVRILPSPKIVDYSHNIRLVEGGSIKQGDLLLRQISKNQYPTEVEIDCSSPSKNIERFYRIGDNLYRVISVKEDHLWWNVQVRRLTDQRRQ